jgi:putative ABC transport system substrate-binding protein
MIGRRHFITLLGGAAAWPLAARAQEDGRTYRLGFLLPAARQTPPMEAFFDELRLNGFVEGKNLVVVPGFEATDNNLAELVLVAARIFPTRDLNFRHGDRRASGMSATYHLRGSA